MLSAELKDALLKTPLCENLDSHELDMLITQSQFVSFATGEIILQQGKKSKGLYIIIEGTAVVTARILGEGTTTLATLDHGNFVGVMSTIGKWPNATSIIASSNVQCLHITEIYLEAVALFFPETKYKLNKSVMKELCSRLLKVHDKITAFMSQADMISRSLFGEVIKSLTKPDSITFERAGIELNLLKKFQPFDVFSADEFDILLQQSSLISAVKRCTLIPENEHAKTCFIVIRGAVQSSIIQNNKFAKLAVLGPMSLFCGISLIDESAVTFINYTTCEQAILLKITGEQMDNVQKNYKALWFKLTDLICKSFALTDRSAEKLDIRLNSELYNR